MRRRQLLPIANRTQVLVAPGDLSRFPIGFSAVMRGDHGARWINESYGGIGAIWEWGIEWGM